MPRIRISPFAVLFAFFAVYSMPPNMLLPYATAVLAHELGHIVATLMMRSPIRSITLSPFGVTIRRQAVPTTHYQDIIIYAAGPLMSLLLGITGALFSLPHLSIFSLALLLLNMLPVKVSDGGKILYSLLCYALPASADRTSKAVSAIFLTLMWLVASYLLIITSELSLFILCLYLFFAIFV